MSQRIVFCFLVAILFLLVNSTSTLAAMALTIKEAPANINFDQEFEVLVNLVNASHNIDYYLQVALTQTESTVYFGYTQKEDGTWYKYSETYDLFYKITTSIEGSWSGKLKGKPDIEDTNFKGTGPYLLKIGRFTSSGKSHYWSDNSLTINIAGPTPIPTLTPTPTPSPTPTPDPISTPTPTNTPTVKPTSTLTPTSTSKPTPTITIQPSISLLPFQAAILLISTESASVAGVATNQSNEASKIGVLVKSDKTKINVFFLISIILSVLFLAGSIFLFYHSGHEGDNQK